MARFLFVSLPLRGHTDWGGMLGTAMALQQRGHAVAWASEPALRELVVNAGLEFLALEHSGWQPQPPLPPGSLDPVLRRRRGLDSWLDVDAVSRAAAELAEQVARWQPDLLVAEPFAAAAAVAAEQRNLPLALCGRPALPPRPEAPPVAPAAERIAELCRRHGVPGRLWDLSTGAMCSPWLHLDFFSRAWYADLPAVGEQTAFVGGRAPQAQPRHDPPWVLVTLGTQFNQDAAFFRTAAEAVFLAGGRPVVVTGAADPAAHRALTASLPAGALSHPWLDFAAVLPQVAAVIHHGGVGTTHAALCHGLPQVAVPHAGDQQPQAGRITQAGVGYGVRPADFTLANARWLADHVLHDEQLRRAAQRWRGELASLGGIAVAAQKLERVAQGARPVV
ncbi:MAG: hypothetical protein NZ528_12150 [Caldilineales bacterium]|nr:hypothetical protein [Caldilineales bacterium]MDW8316954.1 hypothetical protein [Anaerolineae bacterium]